MTNPNDWETVTVKSVTDALDVSIGAPARDRRHDGQDADGQGHRGRHGDICVRVHPPDHRADGLAGNNTATATWDAGRGHRYDGLGDGSGSVNFETGAVTKVNQVITVNDQVAGSTARLLGTVDRFTGIKTLGTDVTGRSGGLGVHVLEHLHRAEERLRVVHQHGVDQGLRPTRSRP